MVESSRSGEAVSARYAAALYALAFERGELDKIVDEMASLGRLIAESDPLARLIASPFGDAGTAKAVDAVLSGQGFSLLIRHFAGVVVKNRRLRDLPRLIAGFGTYVAGRRGEVVADVTSAHGLSDVQRTQLRARLTQAGYGLVRLVEHVDAALLGGLILKIGPKLYDTSLKSRLSRLNYSLKGAS